MDKKELRQEIRQRKKSCTVDERARQSERVCQRIMSEEWWRDSHVVLLYSALPDEVDVSLLVDAARQDGKVVLLPVVVGDDIHLHPFEGETQTGAYGIEEPVVRGECFTDYGSIDVAVIPGMAFDGNRHRLGRGKGYYDRLLSQFPAASHHSQPKTLKVGICFDFQFVEHVPAEEHDILMDEVIHC